MEELIHVAIQKASEDGNTDYLCIFVRKQTKNVYKVGGISVPMQNVCSHQISKCLNFPQVEEKYKQLMESGIQAGLYGTIIVTL